MGKGGGQTATQTTVQDVPEWAKPYYEDILKKSKAASEQPYVPYGGQRLAQVGQDITASQQMIRNIAGRPAAGLGEAMSTLSSLGSQAQQLGQQRPAEFTAGQATPFTGFEAGVARAQQYDPARQFSGQEVSTYMSPYMQAVVDREKASAMQEFERQRGSRAARAIGAGAFGGSRQAVQESLAEEALAKQIGDIQAGGAQRAYEQAAAQFGADRAAQMETQQRQIAELARAEGITLEEAARVQQARAAEQARTQGINIAEQARVQAARADEAMRQREFQLQAMGFSAEQARAAADLGERARAGDIQAAQLLEAQGLGDLSRRQAGLDVAYQDFLRQQGYPMEQLGAYSQFIRGLPVAAAGSSTVYQPQPSPLQQALGAGISAYGLYRGLQ
jgi:hypothetical protein